MNAWAFTVNLQSRRGQSTVRTATPSNAKHPIAIQLAGLTVSPVRARPPKNEVVIAAAPIKTPARDRSSVTTRSCSSNVRLASS
jgi:hypothetical protein